MKSDKVLRIYLGAITFIPALFAIITELNKDKLIWFFRWVDFVDLAITAPFYILLFASLYGFLASRSSSTKLSRTFLIINFLFIYGHAMHVTANAIHTYGTEVQAYDRVIPEDLLALIYFLDESLSHIILLISLYSFFSCLLIFDTVHISEDAKNHRAIVPAGMGVIYGLFQGIASIEAQKVTLVILLSLGLLGLGLYLNRSQGQKLGTFLASGSVRPFVLAWIFAQFIIFLIYRQIFGGFIEPSKLF